MALWLAVQHPRAAAGAGSRSAGRDPAGRIAGSGGTPADMARALYGHPERMPPLPAADPAVQAKQQALTGRLRGPDRDPELEAGMRRLSTPTQVQFGTLDRVMPPEMGRHYKALMPATPSRAGLRPPATQSPPSGRKPSPKSSPISYTVIRPS